MAFVTKADGPNGEALKDWTRVERVLGELDTPIWKESNRDMLLAGRDENHYMSITADAHLGFTVGCFIENDSLQYAAVDISKGTEDVSATVGGQVVETKACLLITKQQALLAANEFYLTGKLAPGVPWIYAEDVEEIDFSRKTSPFVKLLKPDSTLSAIIGKDARPRSRAFADAIAYLNEHGLVVQQGNVYAKADEKTTRLVDGAHQFSYEEFRDAVNKHLLPE